RDEADPDRGLGAAPADARKPLRVVPRAHQPHTEPPVALEQLAVVLLVVRERERLLGAYRLVPLGYAATVEPAGELGEPFGKGRPALRRRRAEIVDLGDLGDRERPPRLDVFRIDAGRLLVAVERFPVPPQMPEDVSERVIPVGHVGPQG